MPIYTYQDKKTETVVEVIREFKDYEVPPTKEEVPQMTEEEFKAAEWERKLSHKIMVAKGNGWGGKGYWTVLLCTLAGAAHEITSWI